MRGIVLFTIFISFQSVIFSAVIKVPGDYPTIQQAIDAAIDGDTVLVAPGTYVENIDFKGKAITVTSEQGVDVTVIDGNQAGSVVTCQSGEDLDSMLEGFTLTNGTGTYMKIYPLNWGYCGGGIFCNNSSPTITNNIIIGNSGDMGGGICNWFNSNLKVMNCTFTGNSTSIFGGGMYNRTSNPTVTDCTFTGNTGDYGGGGMCNEENSSPTVINCAFIGNSCPETGDGGGMHNTAWNGGGSPLVINCLFIGNSSGHDGGSGGGMYNGSSNSTVINCIFIGNETIQGIGGGMNNFVSNPTVTNCIFTGNKAARGGGMSNGSSNSTVINCIFTGNEAYRGGGMSNGKGNQTVINCTFTGNTAKDDGGGMSNIWGNQVVTNCTFTGNTANSGGGMDIHDDNMTVTNCILWLNTPDEITNQWTIPTVTHCCVQGGYPGIGNIDSDPLFVDPANGDLHLTFNSPCRASGNNTAVLDLYDFEGDPRIAYGTVDMGADEFYTHLYWTGDATPGGNVEIKFVGLPGTSPVGLWIGTGVLDPPIPSMWGDWYLAFPIIGPVTMPSIPTTGVSIVPGTIPSTYPSPTSVPMQALIGAELTNLCVLEVK